MRDEGLIEPISIGKTPAGDDSEATSESSRCGQWHDAPAPHGVRCELPPDEDVVALQVAIVNEQFVDRTEHTSPTRRPEFAITAISGRRPIRLQSTPLAPRRIAREHPIDCGVENVRQEDEGLVDRLVAHRHPSPTSPELEAGLQYEVAQRS
jgi:hypothetical protein